jgi:hypothetical protein
MIPTRRWLAAHKFNVTLVHLAIVGAIVGFLTGIVVSTGPISVSIFITYGLDWNVASPSTADVTNVSIAFLYFRSAPMNGLDTAAVDNTNSV